MTESPHGSSFDDFLREEGIYDDARAAVIARLQAEIERLQRLCVDNGVSESVVFGTQRQPPR